MGDEKKRQLELRLDLIQQVDHLGLDGYVEGREGLIGHDDLRVEDEGPGDPDPLTLSAAELVGISVDLFGTEPHFLHDGLDPRQPFFRGQLKMPPQPLPHDLFHGHAGVQGRIGVLENDLHRPPQGAHGAAGQAGDLLPVEPDLSFGWLDQAKDQSSGRGLAAPRFSHQPESLPLIQVEADSVHGPHPFLPAAEKPPAGREIFLQVFDFQ